MTALLDGIREYSRVRGDDDAAGRGRLPRASSTACSPRSPPTSTPPARASASARCRALRAHPVQLAQLFQNLIANAVKFRGDAPPEIAIAARSRARRCWEFTVADNGIGIDREYAERVFDFGQRLHTTTTSPAAASASPSARPWSSATAAASGSSRRRGRQPLPLHAADVAVLTGADARHSGRCKSSPSPWAESATRSRSSASRRSSATRRPRPVGSPIPFVAGVIELRGRAVPVCDVAVRVGVRPVAQRRSRRSWIVDLPGGQAGAARSTRSTRPGEAWRATTCRPLPAEVANDLVSAVAQLGDELVMVLDPDHLLEGVVAPPEPPPAPEPPKAKRKPRAKRKPARPEAAGGPAQQEAVREGAEPARRAGPNTGSPSSVTS